MKKTVILFFSFIVVSFVATSQKSSVFEKDGKALGGYDVVSYFILGEPKKGVDSFSTKWNNATWLFSSTGNLELFKQNPEKHVPQYGGYCAYGTAEGHKAPTQPDAWAIIEGKLYLNYNKKVKAMWDKDKPGYIEKANKNWPDLKDKE